MNIVLFEKWIWNFLGIVIESLPFILVGAIISALIQFYISEEKIKKFIPKNRIIGYLCAVIAGIFFPICECAIVPIARSLIKKGVPIGIGITFMLAVPIVNPIVIMSTYYAFPNDISIVIMRTICGLFIALIVGVIVDIIYKKKNVNIVLQDSRKYIGCDCCNIGYSYKTSKFQRLIQLINHASAEFLTISGYFIFGAFLSSVFSTFISTNILEKVSSNNVVNIGIMMLLAFLLSLCSEADAFVAKGFLAQFGTVGVLAFLILGPMMDLKNAFITLGSFSRKFTFNLIMIIVVLVSIMCVVLTTFGF